MLIPKKIKIGQITYKIKFANLDDDEIIGNVLGYCTASPETREITLDERLKGDSLINVFFHEIMHAVFLEIGSELTDNEMMVQSVANMFQQITEQLIKNNLRNT